MVGAARDGRRMDMEKGVMVTEFMVLFSEGTGRNGIRKAYLYYITHSLTSPRWDASARLGVVSDLYGGVGACGIFRMAQGWLSMSNFKGGEGHLLVNPILKGAMAYLLLRPFFQERKPSTSLPADAYLSPANWVLELETSVSLLPSPLHKLLDLNFRVAIVTRRLTWAWSGTV
jgi:Protein of unknown function (DUF1479)